MRSTPDYLYPDTAFRGEEAMNRSFMGDLWRRIFTEWETTKLLINMGSNGNAIVRRLVEFISCAIARNTHLRSLPLRGNRFTDML